MMKKNQKLKVAIVHDFLTQMGGAEKVVEVLHDMFPEAPIYTSMYDPQAMPDYYRQWDIRTSFLQKMIAKKHSHRLALLLYPAAFESFDLSDYDVVISSSSAFAKGVITQPHTTHICYTHAPMRYAWMTRSYVKNERIGKPFRALLTPGLHYLRTWDSIASNRVDRYVANSSAVAKRIQKFYRHECDVVFPPVDTEKFAIAPEVGDHYIVVSRFVPYKRLDLAVEAFTKLGRPLKVVGTGRQMKALKEVAGPTVEFLGHVKDEELTRLVSTARAFVMPGEEDFGIAAVEAHASGRPVIAFAAGGSLDVQIDGVTGVLFHEQTVDALCEAVLRADDIAFDPATIRASALRRFDTKVFRKRITQVIADSISSKALQAQPRMDDRRMGDRRLGDRRISTSAEPYPNDRRVNDRRQDERRTGDRRGGSRRSVDQSVVQSNGHVGKVLVGVNGVRNGAVDLPEQWKTEELAKLLEESTR
jgi:glycosyltransferase involved in cell wall biosynthesis